MAIDSASALRTGGAMTWTRFLLKSQDCDVRWLNQTLLLPTTEPSGSLSERLAPRVFEDIHEKGKNPDGAYWAEYGNSGGKFNLFERVCERVPKSRPWLLRDFIGYVQPDPAPILESRTRLMGYTYQRGLLFVPGRVVSAVKHLDPVLYADLEQRCAKALVKAATPETLIFVIAFLHEMTWRRRHDVEASGRLAYDAVDEFTTSFSRREFDDADMLAQRLHGPLVDAVANVVVWGDRCAPSKFVPSLEDLSALPFLMEKSREMLDACACLHAAGEEWYECMGRPLPERYQQGAIEVTCDGISSHTPAPASIAAALLALKSNVLRVHADVEREYEDSLQSTPVMKTTRSKPVGNRDSDRRATKLPRRSRPSSGAKSA